MINIEEIFQNKIKNVILFKMGFEILSVTSLEECQKRDRREEC